MSHVEDSSLSLRMTKFEDLIFPNTCGDNTNNGGKQPLEFSWLKDFLILSTGMEPLLFNEFAQLIRHKKLAAINLLPYIYSNYFFINLKPSPWTHFQTDQAAAK